MTALLTNNSDDMEIVIQQKQEGKAKGFIFQHRVQL